MRDDRERIIVEVPKTIADPSGFLWGLSDKPLEVDAVKLVEESWKER